MGVGCSGGDSQVGAAHHADSVIGEPRGQGLVSGVRAWQERRLCSLRGTILRCRAWLGAGLGRASVPRPAAVPEGGFAVVADGGRAQSVNGQQHGLMFLCEAAMGKMKEIISDDSSLRAAPKACAHTQGDYQCRLLIKTK